MLNEKEMSALKEIHKNQLITKMELKNVLLSKHIIDSSVVFESVVNSLASKDLISRISPVGSICYAITQKGSQMISGL